MIEFPHAEIVDGGNAPSLAAELVEGLTFKRYALLDRGSYEVAVVDDHDRQRVDRMDRVIHEMLARASHFGVMLVAIEARVVRLRAGDYLLARHDEVHAAIVNRDDRRRRFELVLDLSPAPTAAEIQYRKRGQVFFRVPCVPGSLSIVERTATVTSNHTYVSKLAPAEVVRLIVQVVVP